MITSKDFEFKQVIFIITKEGEKLSFRNDNIIVTDKDGKVIHQSTCYRLFAVFIVGNTTITSGLMQKAGKFGFAIVFMTTTFRPYHVVSMTGDANVLLRRKQYEYTSLNAGVHLIRNKISNQQLLLKEKRIKSSEDHKSIHALECILDNLEGMDSVSELMGAEGNAAKNYFRAYFDNVQWRGRKPRIKADMINAVLDIGYTQLFCFIESLLNIYGFDIYQGIMHKQFYMRKSLVCDMVEPFRVIIDRQVRKSINLQQFKSDDFKVVNGKWCLQYKYSSKYSNVFMSAILEHKTEMFLYIRSFYRAFMKDKLDTDFPIWRI